MHVMHLALALHIALAAGDVQLLYAAILVVVRITLAAMALSDIPAVMSLRYPSSKTLNLTLSIPSSIITTFDVEIDIIMLVIWHYW